MNLEGNVNFMTFLRKCPIWGQFDPSKKMPETANLCQMRVHDLFVRKSRKYFLYLYIIQLKKYPYRKWIDLCVHYMIC